MGREQDARALRLSLLRSCPPARHERDPIAPRVHGKSRDAFYARRSKIGDLMPVILGFAGPPEQPRFAAAEDRSVREPDVILDPVRQSHDACRLPAWRIERLDPPLRRRRFANEAHAMRAGNSVKRAANVRRNRV